jgi:hypothetical protein
MNPLTSVSLRVQHQYKCAASIPPSDSHLLNHGCCVCPAVSLCYGYCVICRCQLKPCRLHGAGAAIHPFKYAPSLRFFFALLRAFSSLILKQREFLRNFFDSRPNFDPRMALEGPTGDFAGESPGAPNAHLTSLPNAKKDMFNVGRRQCLEKRNTATRTQVHTHAHTRTHTNPLPVVPPLASVAHCYSAHAHSSFLQHHCCWICGPLEHALPEKPALLYQGRAPAQRRQGECLHAWITVIS